MLSRRDLMSAGVTGALYHRGPASAGPDAAAASIGQPERDVREIKASIDSVDSTLHDALLTNSVAHGSVPKIRDYMNSFLRGNGKFPDFMDIGIAIFWDLYDWHIKNRLPLVVTRGPDGRYWMQFLFSTMVLRPEVDPGHIGVPVDKV